MQEREGGEELHLAQAGARGEGVQWAGGGGRWVVVGGGGQGGTVATTGPTGG